MSGLRKPYRIERGGRSAGSAEMPSDQHAEIMAAFADFRALVQPAAEVSQAILEEQRRDLKKARIQGRARRDIAERMVSIFEACNFQDITGQRIPKVVNTTRFIEERVGRMITIWGGLEGFSDVEVQQDPNRAGDRALLNGPALTGEDGVTSQDDIDALFG